MDADDVALPEGLELQVAALDEEGLDACGGAIEYFPRPKEGALRHARWLNALVAPDAAARDVFVECPLPHPTLMARTELVEFPDCGWPGDYDLVLRPWARGARFRNVEQVVLRWRDHPGRLSRTEPRYSQEAFVRCKVHHLRETLLRGRSGAVVRRAGPVGKSFGRELGANLVAFVEVDPRKLGSGSTAGPSSRSARRRASPRRCGSAPWPGRSRESASEDSSRLGVGRKERASSSP